MDRKARWLNKEFKKDENEILSKKKDFIKEILKASKVDITNGTKEIKKESRWKKILRKVTGR